MNAPISTYILSIIDHKAHHEIQVGGDVIDLLVDKSYENNLRERNPQLGRVEAVGDDNPYGLIVGDIVAVNHRTFYGNIGDNRAFIVKDHFEMDGKWFFKVLCEQILFKYNNKTPEPLGDTIICTEVSELSELRSEANKDINFYRYKEFGQFGTVLCGDSDLPCGTRVLTLKYAFYLVTLDGMDYFKVKKSEIVGRISGEDIVPVGKYILIEYIEPEKRHAFLDLSFVKKELGVKARILASNTLPISEMINWRTETPSGDVLVFRNQGVEYNGKRLIDIESIIWRFEYEEA